MRKSKIAVCALVAVLSVLASLASQARAKAQEVRPSPPAKAECKFTDGKTIHVDYSSPRMRGRKIFGDLVPYGEPWRAGANEATTFVINTNAMVGETLVPAGSFTLFTLPTADNWLLIVSRATGEWGIPYPGENLDFARIPMKLAKLSTPLENFTISFDQTGGDCTMNLSWERTKASIRITEKK